MRRFFQVISLILKGSKGQLVTDFMLQGGKLVAGGKTYLRQWIIVGFSIISPIPHIRRV